MNELAKTITDIWVTELALRVEQLKLSLKYWESLSDTVRTELSMDLEARLSDFVWKLEILIKEGLIELKDLNRLISISDDLKNSKVGAFDVMSVDLENILKDLDEVIKIGTGSLNDRS